MSASVIHLSSHQMDAFQSASRTDFICRVTRFLEDHRLLGPNASKQISGTINFQIDIAEGYGFQTEHEIITFVLAAIVLGTDFHRHPQVEAYLSSWRPPDQKLMFLDAMVLAADRMAQVHSAEL